MKKFTKIFVLSNFSEVCFRMMIDHGRINYYLEASVYVRHTLFEERVFEETFDDLKNTFEALNDQTAEQFAKYAYNEVEVLEDENMGLDALLN